VNHTSDARMGDRLSEPKACHCCIEGDRSPGLPPSEHDHHHSTRALSDHCFFSNRTSFTSPIRAFV